MKICMPVERAEGLDAPLFPNFRAAPLLLVIDSDTQACAHVDTRGGGCGALPQGLDVVVYVDGMGGGMFRGMQQHGIRVFRAQGGSARAALDALALGRLEEVHQVACCGGGHHHETQHGHGHGCCGGH